MEITLTNSHIYVEQATPEEEDALYKLLSFRIPNAWFTTSYRRGYWDGYRHLYDKRSRKCDAGFLGVLIELCEELGTELIISDARKYLKRPRPPSLEQWQAFLEAKGFRPHDYVSKVQVKASKRALRQHVADGIPWPRGIFAIATGGGKTFLAANLIKTINKPTLFMMGRLDLMYQTKEVLETILEEEVGVIGDTQRDPKKVTLLMAQTASKVFEDPWFQRFLKSIRVVVLDEAHHLADNTYYDVTKRCTRAYFRYALTATPLRRGDLGDAQLVGAFGQKIIDVRSYQYRKRGALADVAAWVVEYQSRRLPDSISVPVAKRLGLYRNTDRNHLIVEIATLFEKRGWPCLILVDNVLEHGERLQEQFAIERGYKPPLINYRVPKNHRRKLLRQLEDQKLPTIIASIGIFGEGIDAPNIRALIRAEGGRNEIRTLQAAGRGMRRKDPPNVLYLIDFWDQNQKHLEKDSRERIAIYEEERYRVRYIQTAQEIEFPQEISEEAKTKVTKSSRGNYVRKIRNRFASLVRSASQGV